MQPIIYKYGDKSIIIVFFLHMEFIKYVIIAIDSLIKKFSNLVRD